MKQILYVLGLAIVLSGIYTSCKKDSLEALRQDEVAILDKYVKDNKLEENRDPSGIYFKELIPGTGDTIKSGFKVMLQYNIMTMNNDTVFSTENGAGQTFEESPFFVNVSNDVVNANYVQQISGLHIGLKKMRIGERAFMVIPSELAFKAVDYSSIHIPRFSTLLVYVYAKSGYNNIPK